MVMELLTNRLILRDLRRNDLDCLIRNVNNLKVSRYLALVPYPYRKKDGKSFIGHCISESKKKPRENYEFGIELKGEKQLAGVIGLTKVNYFNKKATIGYWLGENYWRQGIMGEAVEKILEFAFRTLKLQRIDVEAFIGNEGSNSLIKKLGFEYEGIRKKYGRSKATGKYRDVYVYGLLRENWTKRLKR